MLREIEDRTAQPFSWAVMIVATYADGFSTRGSGALVGRNDILTATHVLYDPDRGGWAAEVALFPAIDFNAQTNRFESPPLVAVEQFSWNVVGWPVEVFADGDNETLTRAESQYDVALLGLSVPIGDQLGWFGLDPGYNQSQQAGQLGYPSDGTGLMAGIATVAPGSRYSVYSTDAGIASDLMGPGSSGGPLYVNDAGGGWVIIGVKSSGNNSSGYWADIGLTFERLAEAMAENDELLASPALTETGTPRDDVFIGSSVSERFEGGLGTDVLVLSGPRPQFMVTLVDEEEVRTQNQQFPADIDYLFDIERLRFTDGTLALDVDVGERAGQAYRLYQAAFARQPDNDGLKYWIDELDRGASIQAVARGFVDSAEFALLYGASFSPAHFVDALYGNVLGRTPDEAGANYWLGELAGGMAPAGVLVSFAESQENYVNTIGFIEDGIWLT